MFVKRENTSVYLRIGLQHCKPIRKRTNRNSILITHPDTTDVIIQLATHSCFYECVIQISKLIQASTDEFVALIKSFVIARMYFCRKKKYIRVVTDMFLQHCKPIPDATDKGCGVHLTAVCRAC